MSRDFNLSLSEVKNKIRIYRTTYGQELKKLQTSGTAPKLFWFKELHKAFSKGKIKSFRKSTGGKKSAKEDDKMIVIDYQNDEMESSDNESSQAVKYIPKKITKAQETSDSEHHIIIEPYELEYEEEEIYQDPISSTMIKKDPNESTSSTKALTSISSPNPMGSNELFLKSLVSMMDRLPEDKNMRARIKIQEILYKIAYD
jgi:BESS motif